MPKADYYDTSEKYIGRMYQSMVDRSKVKNLSPLTFSKEDFAVWVQGQLLYQQLFDDWVASGNSRFSAPSIDRLDDYIGYTLTNIRLVVYQENLEKGHKDRREGVNNKVSRTIEQLDDEGNVLNTFPSISYAARETETNRGSINQVLAGTRLRAGGYKWRYSCTT